MFGRHACVMVALLEAMGNQSGGRFRSFLSCPGLASVVTQCHPLVCAPCLPGLRLKFVPRAHPALSFVWCVLHCHAFGALSCCAFGSRVPCALELRGETD